MKKFLLIILIIFLTGCTNEKEDVKSEYIAMKNNLIEEKIDNKKEELPLDITINIDRTGEELINYQVILNNPKYNMYNIKAMVVHNYYSEEIYPTIGVFDEKEELLKDTDNKLELTGTIKTTKNISNMNLKIKLSLQYTDESGEIREIYYETT